MYPTCKCEETVSNLLCDMPSPWKDDVIYALCKLNEPKPRHCSVDFSFYLADLPTVWKAQLVEAICYSYTIDCLDINLCKDIFLKTLDAFPQTWREGIVEFICSVVACRNCEEEEETDDDNLTTSSTTTIDGDITPGECPDFTPIISISPLNFLENESRDFLVCINEIGQVSGSIGQVSFTILKLQNFTITFNAPQTTNVFGDTDENQKWTFSEDADHITVTLNVGEVIPANSFSCVGFNIERNGGTPEESIEYIIATIVPGSGGDCVDNNNLIETIVNTIGGPTTTTTTTTPPELTTTTTTVAPEITTSTTTEQGTHYCHEGVEYNACGSCTPLADLIVESYGAPLEYGKFYKAIDFDTTGRIFQIFSNGFECDAPVVIAHTAVGAPADTCRELCTNLPPCKRYQVYNPNTGIESIGFYSYYDCNNVLQNRTINNEVTHEFCALQGSVVNGGNPSSQDLVITLIGNCFEETTTTTTQPPVYYRYYAIKYLCQDCSGVGVEIVSSTSNSLIANKFYRDIDLGDDTYSYKIIAHYNTDPGYATKIVINPALDTCAAACAPA